tara:strand:+ start:220 stop:672 length:453 start_codon:yes stop_codon:yes gene_type:complete
MNLEKINGESNKKMSTEKIFRYFCYLGIIGPIYLFISALFQPNIPLFPWSDLTYQEQLDLYPGVLNGRSNLATYPMFLYIVHPYFYLKYLRTSKFEYVNILYHFWVILFLIRITALLIHGIVLDDYAVFAYPTEIIMPIIHYYFREKLKT